MWTFGKRIAAGFVVSSILLLGIGISAHRSIDLITSTSYWVAHTHEVLEHINGTVSAVKDAETGQRGFIITGDDAFLDPYRDGVSRTRKELQRLRQLTQDNARQQKNLDQLEPLIASRLEVMARLIEVRRQSGLEAASKLIANGEGNRLTEEIREFVAAMDNEERALLKQRAEDVDHASRNGEWTIIGGTLASLIFVTLTGIFLVRSLTGLIGSAVSQMQSSSAELLATANQQATGATEQATSMNEIATTISELLATSRQIAESSQRVAQIADQTTQSALAGENTVAKATASITGIRHQVDLIVGHMLELGKKSQQIGAVLDIVAELSEQTNILAINATIEAAGAGEAGSRFAVVADEIRKLADRVSNSTKEIRVLIDDVRGAVNTTVMTTETGSKAVDAGTRQFGDVAAVFQQIATLIGTTTEASREIQLSTKQQSSAVEQVNIAITSAAQATKENEASSTQVLQTSSQLTGLSHELLRMVRPQKLGAMHGA